MNNILELENINKAYKSFSLKDISFSLPYGYIMGFVGSNGAGKTTTIKLILDIINPDSGKIRVFGKDKKLSQNGDIGIVMDSLMYVDDWNVEDLEEALSPFYRNWDMKAFRKYIEDFNLNRKVRMKELSRGMKVKLQIAVALSHHAKLLILDEPTSGLDPLARDEICDILRDFISDGERSVLFSTHITEDLNNTADFIAFIMDGSLVFTGTKDSLLEKYIRVAGGLGELNQREKKLVIGYREHASGFEGMIEKADESKIPPKILMEKISLDEIIIFMNKGAKSNGQN